MGTRWGHPGRARRAAAIPAVPPIGCRGTAGMLGVLLLACCLLLGGRSLPRGDAALSRDELPSLRSE